MLLVVVSLGGRAKCDAEEGLERGMGASGGVVEGVSGVRLGGAIVVCFLGAGILFVRCGERVRKRDRSKWRGSRGGE